MASKSFRNTVATIAMANGIALVMKQHTDAATPTGLAASLDTECKAAFNCWPESMDKTEIQKIYASLAQFERRYIPEQGRPELLTSITLGLIDDILNRVKDPVKRSALGRVEHALWKIHQYYDRRLDKHDIYDLANMAIDGWNRRILI
jgi:hypothetical protein